jgi:DNA-binding PadR family transcriptional regulator
MPARTPDPYTFLPLTAALLHVLLSLADGDTHGYAIIKEVQERTNGEVAIGAGTLYSMLKRLLADGLVVESGDRPDPERDDERRRYYRLTPLGREVAVAEIGRLESLVSQARQKHLMTATPAPGHRR